MIVPKLRAPIVLVHGLLGFDRLGVGPVTLASYFPGIPQYLRQAGNRVLIPRLSPTSGVAVRGEQLRAFIDRESPGDPVHIIAHSMGGLDARYMISRLQMGGRVLTLTTIATPHRGTPVADWGLKRFARLLKPLFGLFDFPYQAFYDLTTSTCREFNEQVPDAQSVRYFAIAGRHEGTPLFPEWELLHRLVMHGEGPNDGVVSILSASYGESTDVWEGDHMSLVNWPSRRSQLCGLWRDRTPNYGGLVRRLADEGF
jgi:triacylglycerol lipase